MKTDKHKFMAALVRSFFDAFSSGVIDCGQGTVQERRQPQNVKRAMLDYYEQIAPAYFESVFFPLAVVNSDYKKMERMVRESFQQRMNIGVLFSKACGSEAFYEAMVAEYKRNYNALLEGACPSVADHLAACAGKQEGEGIDTDQAIELTVRAMVRAYASGLKLAGGQGASFRQASLYRLLLDAMNVLLHDEKLDYSDCGESIIAMLVKACGSEQRFAVAKAAMDRAQQDIMG